MDTEKYKHIDYGYALTTYKAQGHTYNNVVIEVDTSVPILTDMRNQYVNITRTRDDIKIFTDDKEYLKELVEIKMYARDTISLSYTLEETKAKDRKMWDNMRANLSEETKYQEPARQDQLIGEKHQNNRTPEQPCQSKKKEISLTKEQL